MLGFTGHVYREVSAVSQKGKQNSTALSIFSAGKSPAGLNKDVLTSVLELLLP